MKNDLIHIGGRETVNPDDIMILEAVSNYTLLYLQDGRYILVATTLKILEEKFNVYDNFFRTHRSHVVNINFINSYHLNLNLFYMQNQKQILISRRRKSAFELKVAKNINCFDNKETLIKEF